MQGLYRDKMLVNFSLFRYRFQAIAVDCYINYWI